MNQIDSSTCDRLVRLLLKVSMFLKYENNDTTFECRIDNSHKRPFRTAFGEPTKLYEASSIYYVQLRLKCFTPPLPLVIFRHLFSKNPFATKEIGIYLFLRFSIYQKPTKKGSVNDNRVLYQILMTPTPDPRSPKPGPQNPNPNPQSSTADPQNSNPDRQNSTLKHPTPKPPNSSVSRMIAEKAHMKFVKDILISQQEK